jgi:hypothetical protein
MAGSISLSISQQFDQLGNPLAGGLLFFIEAGTTSTPQNAYQDSALTLPWPNPLTLDAAGRVPQLYFADGLIKIRLEDKNGVTQVVADNILVVGPSSGGGSGPSVDPTTILATGDMKITYGTGTLVGFVRANGRTIGSSTSGASERANADAQALFQYLWGADPNLVVSTGRGVSANADWVANKTITLPDWRGRAIAGLGDMGNSDAGRLTSGIFGSTPTTLGVAGGGQSQALLLTNLPSIPLSVSGTVTVTSVTSAVQNNTAGSLGINPPGGSTFLPVINSLAITSSGSATLTGTGGGSATAFSTLPPMMLTTIYIKL